MRTERQGMHIDRPHEVTVAREPAGAARPSSSSGLVFVPTSGTPAAGSSFGAGRARDAGLRRFLCQVVDVLAVFPLRHASVVMPSAITAADTMRVADEERPHAVRDAEVDDLPRGLVPQIADAPLGTAAQFVLGALELLPAARILPAPVLLFGELAELLTPLPLEAADAAPSHDQRLGCAGRDGGKVDFSQVDGRLHRAGSLFRQGNFDANVQLEATIPHERTRSGALWKRKW